MGSSICSQEKTDPVSQLEEIPITHDYKRVEVVDEDEKLQNNLLGSTQTYSVFQQSQGSGKVLYKCEEDSIKEKDENHIALINFYKNQPKFPYKIPNQYNESNEDLQNQQISESETYSGQMVNNLRQGYGLQIIKNTSIFEGYWDQDAWAEGILILQNGDVYKGFFKDGSLQGQGEFKKQSGYLYKGELVNSKPDGNGYELLESLETYQGQFKNGERNGFGIKVHFEGNNYWGMWKEGVKEGKGKMMWNDGRIYDGEWKNDLPDGQGTMTWSDGRIYDGQWQEGIINGKGIMKWPNKQKYDGEFLNGLKHGMGIYWWPNGIRYEGKFKAGLQHGTGYIIQDGIKQKFQFREGKRSVFIQRQSKVENNDINLQQEQVLN